MCAALKLEATVVGATVVDGEDHIALLGEEHKVEVAATQPAVGHQLRVGTAINVDERRILLTRLHIGRSDKAVVEIGLAVSRFDCAKLHLWHSIVLQGVLGFIDIIIPMVSRLVDISDIVHLSRIIYRREIIYHTGTFLVDNNSMRSFRTIVVCQAFHRPIFQIHTIGIAAVEIVLVCIDKDILALLVELDKALNLVLSAGHLLHQRTIHIIEVEVFVAVAH